VRQVQAALLCLSAEHDVVLQQEETSGVEIEETTVKQKDMTQHPVIRND